VFTHSTCDWIPKEVNKFVRALLCLNLDSCLPDCNVSAVVDVLMWAGCDQVSGSKGYILHMLSFKFFVNVRRITFGYLITCICYEEIIMCFQVTLWRIVFDC
jgi:hypothetical protein